MGLLSMLTRRPAPRQPLRFIVATRRESEEAARKRTEVMCQLAIYKAITTPEQRRAETEQFFSRARAGR